tara:strand:+ start:1104 stop:2171 length:1068 start_codon:yes stop_codon:yes gene_type:complete
MNRCIFRYNDKKGICCNNYTTSKFCIIHKNIKNKIYEYIYNLIKNPDKEINSFEILQIYNFLYNNIYEIDNRKKMLSSILGKKDRMIEISNNIGLKIKKSELKKKILSKIFEKLEWYCMVFKLKNLNNKIIKIQKLWKEYVRKIIGYNLLPCSNNEDIFSFEPLNEINHVFYFKDNNITYGFSVQNLFYFIIKSGTWNPYTKNQISENDLSRLQIYIEMKKIKINDKIKWKTPEQAYTDVVLKMESNGFYIDIKWFLEMKFNDIIKVINKYHQLSILMPVNYLCNECINSNYPEYIYEFCNMIMELLDDNPDNNFTYLCIFYKSLTCVSNKFKEHAPTWIRDIEPTYYIEINMLE